MVRYLLEISVPANVPVLNCNIMTQYYIIIHFWIHTFCKSLESLTYLLALKHLYFM